MKLAIKTLQNKINQLNVELRIWKDNPLIVKEINSEIRQHVRAIKLIQNTIKK